MRYMYYLFLIMERRVGVVKSLGFQGVREPAPLDVSSLA
jgi:hypothetical protein